MRRLIVFLITLYQKTLSPDHGPNSVNHPYGFCRFYPTCSEYTKQSVQRFGAIRGLWLGLLRLIRCHPWSQGGIDPVPQQLQKKHFNNTNLLLIHSADTTQIVEVPGK